MKCESYINVAVCWQLSKLPQFYASVACNSYHTELGWLQHRFDTFLICSNSDLILRSPEVFFLSLMIYFWWGKKPNKKPNPIPTNNPVGVTETIPSKKEKIFVFLLPKNCETSKQDFCQERWELFLAHADIYTGFSSTDTMETCHQEALLCPPAAGALSLQLLHAYSEELT